MITITWTFPEWVVFAFVCLVVGLSLVVAGLAIWEKWELHVMRRNARIARKGGGAS